jgi:hypothetical protein
MPDETPTILPVLRERAVYVKDDGTGSDNSDFINKSFKGILRLSPNDSAAYLEKENYISYNDTTKDYITFQDDITEQLSKQFIRVSSSDGHLLDLRISSEGVEYNNLYVLGATKIEDSIQLYAADKRSFKLGDTHIVSDRNNNVILSERNRDNYVPINGDTLSDTFILVNTNNNGMDFVNAKNLIDLFIKEALMSLSSIPTGSIHAIPVNIEQYQALLKRSKGHNIVAENNDPLIRDFLLCDGSYYRSTDFPELAKILHKEKVHYWKTIVEDDTDNNTRKAIRQEMTSETNGVSYIDVYNDVKFTPEGIEKGEPEETRVFRVPDLRGMFFQSATMGLNAKNTVGEYESDSIRDARLMIEHGLDQHYHYIVLDNPLPSVNTTSGTLANTSFNREDYIEKEKVSGKKVVKVAACRPAAMARYGAIVSNDFKGITNSCGSCCRSCWGSAGSSGIYRPVYRTFNCTVGGPSGGYIFSTPTKELASKIGVNNWLGVSSWAIDMSVAKEEYKDIVDFDTAINYTADIKDPIYRGYKKNYVSYDDSMKQILGYENSPEFYAILPLIKI